MPHLPFFGAFACLASLGMALPHGFGNALPNPGQVGLVRHVPLSQPSMPAPDAIVGLWIVENDDARVQVYRQGNAYFGKVVALKNYNDPTTGRPKLDKHNPDLAKRPRAILGLVILTALTYNADEGEWDGGSIYDPTSGNTYDCTAWFDDPEGNTMKVRGYWGFVYRTSTWKRVR